MLVATTFIVGKIILILSGDLDRTVCILAFIIVTQSSGVSEIVHMDNISSKNVSE